MKFNYLILSVVFFSTSIFAFDKCADLHGAWAGKCVDDQGNESQFSKTIQQSDCNSITMDKTQYTIGKENKFEKDDGQVRQVGTATLNWAGMDGFTLVFHQTYNDSKSGELYADVSGNSNGKLAGDTLTIDSVVKVQQKGQEDKNIKSTCTLNR